MKDQPVEEVKSLVGKIDKSAMGEKSARSKPKREKKKAVKKSEGWELKGGNILEEGFEKTTVYLQRPKEITLIYKNC